MYRSIAASAAGEPTATVFALKHGVGQAHLAYKRRAPPWLTVETESAVSPAGRGTPHVRHTVPAATKP